MHLISVVAEVGGSPGVGGEVGESFGPYLAAATALTMPPPQKGRKRANLRGP